MGHKILDGRGTLDEPATARVSFRQLSHCEQKQVVEVEPIFKVRLIYGQSIQCVKCKHKFDITLPYEIVSGPEEHVKVDL